MMKEEEEKKDYVASLVNSIQRIRIGHPELQSDNHSPQYFIFKLLPTSEVLGRQNGPDFILRLGDPKPYDLQFDVAPGTFLEDKPGPVLTVSAPTPARLDADSPPIPPPVNLDFWSKDVHREDWYAVRVGLVPGVYWGWMNAFCSAMGGAHESAQWASFSTRQAALDQYAQWARANELEMVYENGSHHLSLSSYHEIDKISDGEDDGKDDGKDEDEDDGKDEDDALLKEATEEYFKQGETEKYFNISANSFSYS
ncbi:hypothetical protein C8J56DRAFT_904066 [Mycena floridula]|nr:hypothetical protein C8J56DRAFT_904066 [Mycena floridula]